MSRHSTRSTQMHQPYFPKFNRLGHLANQNLCRSHKKEWLTYHVFVHQRIKNNYSSEVNHPKKELFPIDQFQCTEPKLFDLLSYRGLIFSNSSKASRLKFGSKLLNLIKVRSERSLQPMRVITIRSLWKTWTPL